MALLNLGAGLSSMGGAIAQEAGSMALVQQKADLEKQQAVLINQLTAEREHVGRVEQGQIQSGLNAQQNEAAMARTNVEQSGALTRTNVEQSGAMARTKEEQAGALTRTNIEANAPPPEVKEAKWYATATPEQKRAYEQDILAKAGIPPSLVGAETGAPSQSSPPQNGAAPATNDGSGPAQNNNAPSSKDGAQPPAASGAQYNEKALDGLPTSTATTIKAMVEGRMAPPTSFAMSKPYWQVLMAKASEYDPTFDQTSWASRVATRKDFTAGKSAQAITAMNTALGHAGVVADSFDKLDNFGGIATPLNRPVNALESAFGDQRQTNAQVTVSALASEARKVFAASGGGNLAELEQWEKNFPYNGSPEQQKGAMGQFANLLESRLEALSDQYNRGMGRTDDPLKLLEPHAQQVFENLTGRKPEGDTGYQTGKPATAAIPPSAAGADITAALKQAGLPYEPDRYDYRIGPDGAVQRRLKVQ